MFESFSTTFLGNRELISITLVIGLICVLATWIYRYLPKEKKQTPSVNPSVRLFQKLTIHDAFWMIFLCLLYSTVALWDLGSFATIESYWQPVAANEEVILELADTRFDSILWVSGEGNNNANPDGYQNQVNFLIQGSNDLNLWFDITELTTVNYLKIQQTQGVWDYRYIKIVSRDPSNVLNEIGFKKTGKNELASVTVHSSIQDSPYCAEALIDEQDFLNLNPSYVNETFFDEIYHTRNAQEIHDQQHMYAYVHPLFGTQLIALGISVFGLSPFGWRIAGALFGIAMMPLLYLCALYLFHKRRSAILATVLLGVEFMHFTTSRIGTLEPFSVFFILLMTTCMLMYVQTSFHETPLCRQLFYLALSGIFMGCACATKFTGVYGGIGLAVLFFTHIFECLKTYLDAKKTHKNQRTITDVKIIQSFWPTLIKTGLWCILFFILVPLCIYVASYLPVVMDKTDSFSIKAVYDQTLSMYNYHKTLSATHPYQSIWWQWIFDIRPIWYYVRYNPETMNTISCMGNPIVFYAGAAAIIWCIIDAFKNRNQCAKWILICYLAQLIPWLAVDRCVFIYHYYPSVPFLILAIVHAAESLLKQDKAYIKPILILTLLSIIVFVLFLPAIGGFETTASYIHHVLRWMESWYFG